MPGSASTQATRPRCGGSAERHLVPLTGEWALWRDLAVRSAGFPMHAFDPFPVDPAEGHGPRITIGRTVWRRETWLIPAEQGPQRPEDAATWARGRGMPRRVFALAPSEIKPVYVDFDSPVLTRILCRQFRRAAAITPGQPVRFTEMLPEPEDCWLTDQDGRHYTSELRIVAVDLRRRASGHSPSRRGNAEAGHAPLHVITGDHDDVP